MRTIVEIPEKQLKDLSYLCSSQNISRAEAIRKAISMYISETLNNDKDLAFGIWKSKNIDGIKYQNELREEWR